MRFFTFLFLIFISISKIPLAQPCSGPGRTAQTANSVCGTLIFHEDRLNPCTGPNLPPSGCTDPVTSSNSNWYKFHCFQSGTLAFTITPGLATDDYDWQLMDHTGLPPGNVYTTNLRLSLNLSAITGPTGCSAAGTLDMNCAGGAPGSEFNRMPDLIAGHDYLLMVTNWSNSGIGYDIDFVGGTAILTNNQLPTITNAGIVGCNASLLKLTFSEDILCSSLTPLGTEFIITGGSHTITGISSSCSSGSNTFTELTLALQNPIPSGNYRITVNNGTDGNTLIDVCQSAMPVGTFYDFTVPVQPPLVINQVSFTGCAPVVLKVALNNLVLCSSVTLSGSEFSILPGNPVITSIQSTCNTGALYTDTLNIVLQNPLAPGNYQLVINNGSDGNTLIDTCGTSIAAGYIFPFVINTTTVAPVIQSISFDECHPDKVILNFDKPVSCASLTAAGSEFTVSPGVWPVNSIISNCGLGTYTSQVTLNLLNPLPAGNFTVNINNGTDGNTLSDTCGSFIPAGYTRSFTATLAPAPIFDSVQIDKCNPAFVKVFYSHPILCSSISPNGSEFSITGPSAVNIVSATPDITCTQGYTKWILLQFATAINTLGNYVLYNGTGSDGNGIIDTCNAIQNTAETISFNVIGKPSAVFNGVVNWGCVTDTIVLSHPGGNGANSWTWNFSDGSIASGQNVTRIFPVATPSVTVQLIVSNGFCSDTASNTFTLGNVFQSKFTNTPADTFCINTPVNFTNTSTGNISNYLWDFGDGTQYIGQNPPTHVYTLSNIYTVQLTVTDNLGCTNSFSKLMTVNTTAFIDFTGLRPQYCTGNQVVLTRRIANSILSYVWDNGDGKTFTNEVEVNFSYANEGVYNITLTGMDRYCGLSSISKTVPVYAVPKVSLGPDTVLCQSEKMLIGVIPVNNYTYQWNTGATSSQIYTDIFTRDYNLTADNNGCRGYDALSIKVLPACLIKVPGAFTPNGDGLNDVLKAVNADLAKNFSFKIYNRLGQLMFNTNNPLDGWDGYFKGNRAETGTFVWTLSYTDPWTGKDVNTKGTSILIR